MSACKVAFWVQGTTAIRVGSSEYSSPGSYSCPISGYTGSFSISSSEISSDSFKEVEVHASGGGTGGADSNPAYSSSTAGSGWTWIYPSGNELLSSMTWHQDKGASNVAGAKTKYKINIGFYIKDGYIHIKFRLNEQYISAYSYCNLAQNLITYCDAHIKINNSIDWYISAYRGECGVSIGYNDHSSWYESKEASFYIGSTNVESLNFISDVASWNASNGDYTTYIEGVSVDHYQPSLLFTCTSGGTEWNGGQYVDFHPGNVTPPPTIDGYITLTKSSDTITYPDTAAYFTVNTYSGGVPTVSTNNSNIATASFNGANSQVTVTRKGYGSATITVTTAAKGQYKEASATYTITCKKASQSAPSLSNVTVNYPNKATATATGGHGSLEWTNGNEQSGVGSKTTKARWAGDSNYDASSYSNEITLTVNKGNQDAPTAQSSTTTYPTTATATASGGGGQGTLTWTGSGNTRTVAGSHTTRAYWNGNANYEASPYSNEVTVQVLQANPSVSASITNAPQPVKITKVATDLATVTPTTPGHYQIRYSLDEKNWTNVAMDKPWSLTNKPKIPNGTYTVQYSFTPNDTTNYKSISNIKIGTVTIKVQSGSIYITIDGKPKEGQLYIKHNGEWHEIICHAMHDGKWNEATSI